LSAGSQSEEIHQPSATIAEGGGERVQSDELASPPDEEVVNEVWGKAVAKHETQEELVTDG
jgi:hypothetical protein